eukprot:gnl/MRDRNA2_/MRDRNA2_194693_c0_seq1.p1 gnl/MRDRNA2_/MRDRNA2_194693_c0~~gnl/MRDRNA2_/MRDRNA2_194693_c0_seq1.p1  ORF type:complete len:253 (-),score=38.12 gnl/MRDRNA2_/MRDRNA2_194693_c0_seq1:117-875(-)
MNTSVEDISIHEGAGYRLMVKARAGDCSLAATRMWPEFDYFAKLSRKELCSIRLSCAKRQCWHGDDGSICHVKFCLSNGDESPIFPAGNQTSEKELTEEIPSGISKIGMFFNNDGPQRVEFFDQDDCKMGNVGTCRHNCCDQKMIPLQDNEVIVGIAVADCGGDWCKNISFVTIQIEATVLSMSACHTGGHIVVTGTTLGGEEFPIDVGDGSITLKDLSAKFADALEGPVVFAVEGTILDADSKPASIAFAC